MPGGLRDVVVHVAVAEVAERHGPRARAHALDYRVRQAQELRDQRHRHRDVVLDAAAFALLRFRCRLAQAPEALRLRQRARDHAVADEAALSSPPRAARSIRDRRAVLGAARSRSARTRGGPAGTAAALPAMCLATNSTMRRLMNSNAVSAAPLASSASRNSGSTAARARHGDQRGRLLLGCGNELQRRPP